MLINLALFGQFWLDNRLSKYLECITFLDRGLAIIPQDTASSDIMDDLNKESNLDIFLIDLKLKCL